MIKQRHVDWQDTNMSLFGSDIEKACKAAAAQGEPQWRGAGTKVGVQIWRIEQFKVVAWPRQKYGSFHTGDSYIVLSTTLDPEAAKLGSEKLCWDIHFWLGENTSLDEQGTAAYKTVELDDLMGGAPVQHRECMNYESEAFTALFSILELLVEALDIPNAHLTHNLVTTLHLTYRPLQGLSSLVGIGNDRQQEMRNTFIDREFEHLWVDHDQSNFLWRCLEEERQEHGVQAHRFTTPCGACYEEVRHFGQVGHDRSGCRHRVLSLLLPAKVIAGILWETQPRLRR